MVVVMTRRLGITNRATQQRTHRPVAKSTAACWHARPSSVRTRTSIPPIPHSSTTLQVYSRTYTAHTHAIYNYICAKLHASLYMHKNVRTRAPTLDPYSLTGLLAQISSLYPYHTARTHTTQILLSTPRSLALGLVELLKAWLVFYVSDSTLL